MSRSSAIIFILLVGVAFISAHPRTPDKSLKLSESKKSVLELKKKAVPKTEGDEWEQKNRTKKCTTKICLEIPGHKECPENCEPSAPPQGVLYTQETQDPVQTNIDIQSKGYNVRPNDIDQSQDNHQAASDPNYPSWPSRSAYRARLSNDYNNEYPNKYLSGADVSRGTGGVPVQPSRQKRPLGNLESFNPSQTTGVSEQTGNFPMQPTLSKQLAADSRPFDPTQTTGVSGQTGNFPMQPTLSKHLAADPSSFDPQTAPEQPTDIHLGEVNDPDDNGTRFPVPPQSPCMSIVIPPQNIVLCFKMLDAQQPPASQDTTAMSQEMMESSGPRVLSQVDPIPIDNEYIRSFPQARLSSEATERELNYQSEVGKLFPQQKYPNSGSESTRPAIVETRQRPFYAGQQPTWYGRLESNGGIDVPNAPHLHIPVNDEPFEYTANLAPAKLCSCNQPTSDLLLSGAVSANANLQWPRQSHQYIQLYKRDKRSEKKKHD